MKYRVYIAMMSGDSVKSVNVTEDTLEEWQDAIMTETPFTFALNHSTTGLVSVRYVINPKHVAYMQAYVQEDSREEVNEV